MAEGLSLIFLWILLYSGIVNTTHDKSLIGIKCADKVLLRVNQYAKVQVCQLETKDPNISVTASINAFRSLCRESKALPIIQQQISSRNHSKSFDIVFKNVSWDDSGIIEINFQAAVGIAYRKNISIHVADIPSVPSGTYNPCQENGVFCFNLKLPEQHHCSANVTDVYWFNYTSTCLSSSKGRLKCDDLINNAKKRILKCKDNSLNVCSNPKLGQCWFHIDLFGYNEIGFTDVRHLKIFSSFIVPQQELVVNYVRAEAVSNSKLKIVWQRPNCLSMTYNYKMAYKANDSNNTQQKDTFLPHYPDDGPERSTTLSNLKPFTTYTICLQSILDVADLHYRQGACAVSKTLEAVPSKAPTIINTFSQKIDNEHWNCKLSIKAVERQFWNGKVQNIQLEIRGEKTPMIILKRLNISVTATEYVILDLDVKREYFVQLTICTNGGCKASERKLISVEHSDKEHSWVSIILGLVIAISACLAFVVPYLMINRKRYARLQNSDSAMTISEIDQVRPRDSQEHIYEEVADDHYNDIQ